jgi:predicted nucleic acid-binding protein
MPRMLDSNVLLDIVTADPTWLDWSRDQFRAAAAAGPVLINPVIYAELAPAFQSQAALDRWLRPTLFDRLRLPYEAGYRASQAFVIYRERGGAKTSPLPDFYIGAHAETAGLTLVTRDAIRYRTYFPKLKLITPEKHQFQG